MVDATVATKLASQFGIQGYPTIKAFPSGKKTASSANDYQGARSVKALTQFATAMLPNLAKAVKPAKVSTWFKSGSSKKPKALFVTSKATTPLLVKGLAVELEELMSFGTVVTSDTVLEQLGLEKAPALLVSTASADEPTRYQGEMKMAPLHEFLKQYASGASSTSAGAESGDQTSGDEEEVEDDVTNLVPLVDTQEAFEDECSNKLGLCVLALFGSGEDVHSYMDEVVKVAKRMKQLSSSPFHFVQVNRTVHINFAKAFIEAGEDEPGVILVALHTRKKRFARFVGAFNEEAIFDFLTRLKKGKQSTRVISTIPRLLSDESVSAEAGGASCSAEAEQCTAPPNEDKAGAAGMPSADSRSDPAAAAEKDEL